VDLLSQAVEALRLRRVDYRFGSVPGAAALVENGAALHLVERGQVLLVAGKLRQQLAAGDVLLVPRPLARTFVPVARAASAQLLSGEFEFASADHPLLSALPAVVYVTCSQLGGNAHWAAQLASLRAELAEPREGSRALIARLTEVLLIHSMRAFPPPAGAECPHGGELRGLYDERLQPVLNAIHSAPSHSWTLAKLAKLAGQSRSAFAAHFTAAMGEAPMSYLARWRMFRARLLLRESELGLATIAEQVGYGSAAAFSLAFSREHGVSPGAFRSASRQSKQANAVGYRVARA
jgi:AraC-like DNA-binding protein